MNSPTIAAVVPGPKPQAGRAPDASEAPQGGSFADVLAGQASPSRGDEPQAAAAPSNPPGAPSDTKAAGDAKSGDTDTRDVADAGEAEADGALSALPQIALEIALHARDHAARGRQAPADAEPSLRTRDVAVDDRAAERPASSAKAALRGDATSALAVGGEDAEGMPAQDAASAAEGRNPSASSAYGAPAVTVAELAQPGPVRAARHQTSQNPALAPVASPGGTAAGQPGAANAGQASARRDTFDPALVAAQETLAQGERAEAGARLQPPAEPPSIAPGASAGLNPFAAPASAGPVAGPAVATPLHQPGWNADFGRQVVMLARDAHSGAQTAELRLDPPELGPLRISISLNEGMASALFVSSHASVRQAVESALPQLSQQLAQAGISLGETHVGDQGQAGFSFNEGDARPGARGAGLAAAGGSTAPDAAAPRRPVAANALVDTFA